MTTLNELARLAREWAAHGARSKWSTLPSLRLWDAVTALPAEPITLWRYTVPPESDKFSGWGIFLIDSSGMMTCVTDYGNYAFKWSSIGERDIRSFLCTCDQGYLTGKLDSSKHYNENATIKHIKETIVEDRKSGALSRDVARTEWDLLCDSSLFSEHDFGEWMKETSYADAYEFAVYNPSAAITAFCERLWPRLVAQLEQQLEQENADAS